MKTDIGWLNSQCQYEAKEPASPRARQALLLHIGSALGGTARVPYLLMRNLVERESYGVVLQLNFRYKVWCVEWKRPLCRVVRLPASILHTHAEKRRFVEQIFTFGNLVLGFCRGQWRGFGRGYMGFAVRMHHFWVTTHAVVVGKRVVCEVQTRGFWGKTRRFSSSFVAFCVEWKACAECMSLCCN